MTPPHEAVERLERASMPSPSIEGFEFSVSVFAADLRTVLSHLRQVEKREKTLEADRWDDGQAWLKARGCAPTEKGDGVVVPRPVLKSALRIIRAFSPQSAAASGIESAMIAATQQATGEGVGRITGDQLHDILCSFDDRADVSEIADKINAALATQQEGVGWDFPYSRTFNAIADAVTREAAGIGISVEAFQRSFNESKLPGTLRPLPPTPDASQDHPHRNAADGGSSNEGGAS